MIETIISLSPKMKRRLDFDHELLDQTSIYKLEKDKVEEVLHQFLQDRSEDNTYILTMANLWIVKDLVCRFRAHWNETLPMTDDLVSEGLAALSEAITTYNGGTKQSQFYDHCESLIHNRMRDYINDNRGAFSASTRTNRRRQKDDRPLEYGFATEVNDEVMGGEVNDPYLIDVLDAIEQLNDVDAEEMRDLVYHFLKQNHDISEEELTAEEREALERLTDYVRNAK